MRWTTNVPPPGLEKYGELLGYSYASLQTRLVCPDWAKCGETGRATWSLHLPVTDSTPGFTVRPLDVIQQVVLQSTLFFTFSLLKGHLAHFLRLF